MTFRYLIPAVVLIFMISCNVDTQTACPEGLEPFNKVTLYFGLTTSEGEITAEEWDLFIEEIATPNFPEGMTVYDSFGKWMNPEEEIISQPGKVLVHLFDTGTDKSAEIEDVISEFKNRFGAQSVIREQEITCVSF